MNHSEQKFSPNEIVDSGNRASRHSRIKDDLLNILDQWDESEREYEELMSLHDKEKRQFLQTINEKNDVISEKELEIQEANSKVLRAVEILQTSNRDLSVIEALVSSLRQIEKEADATSKTNEDRIKQLEDDVTLRQAQIRMIQDRIEAIDEMSADLSDDMESLETDDEIGEDRTKQLQEPVRALGTLSKELRKTKDKAESVLHRRQDRIEELREDSIRWSDHVTRLGIKISDLQESITKLQRHLTTAESL